MNKLTLFFSDSSGVLRSRDEQLAGWLACLIAAILLVFIGWPVFTMLGMTVKNSGGDFIGLSNWSSMLVEPRLLKATKNSVVLALTTLLIVLPVALAFAFALTRTTMAGRTVFRVLALSPMLAPSLMPAISLVYLFGNQGLLKNWLGDTSIYGFPGIVSGEIFYTFPHALLILTAALSITDARLYEAAETLGASKLRRFWSITLPNARYGIVSAGMVVFTLVVTDFGVPKVIGGQINVLALEAYKQVIGQQNFSKGAVVGGLLLLPAVLSFAVEQWIARRRPAQMTGRSVVYQPRPSWLRDLPLWLLCLSVSLFILSFLGVAIAASFIKLWPYDMSLSWTHFDFEKLDGGGWQSFINSAQLAFLTTIFGTSFIFISAYLVIKMPVPRMVANIIRSLAILPMAVPGMVLGLGFIFLFNSPANPLHSLYGTMTLLVIATIAHFYTTAYMTLVTTLRQLDAEMESVARSLCRPWWYTMSRVTLPVCLPALLDVARYLFVSGMTTVSCVIFLYTPDTTLAAVAVLNMDDAGDTASAAAMASLIVISSLVITLLMNALGWWINRHKQAWRLK